MAAMTELGLIAVWLVVAVGLAFLSELQQQGGLLVLWGLMALGAIASLVP
jgi:hypothetical protein